MKKYIYTFLAFLIAIGAQAQSIYDALSFAESEYYGTARSMAMGNAMTALGSDLGSIAINPAGGAVAGYSQISLTPGISISSTKAGIDDLAMDENKGRNRFIIPNAGVNLNFNLNNNSIRRISIGFVANMSNSYNYSFNCGARTRTSYAGALASYATSEGFKKDDLADFYDNNDWTAALGNRVGMIDVITPSYSACKEWYGVTENNHVQGIVANRVSTDYFFQTSGSKADYMFNMGMDIQDIVFIGATMGIQTLSYRMEKRLDEVALREIEYATRFGNLTHSYDYSAKGVGLYGKFGIIVTPAAGLRLGAAITTPTLLNINETWINRMSVQRYMDDSKDRTITKSDNTPQSESRYKFSSPFRFNAGAAYAFSRAIFSVDYEMVDYGKSRFKEHYYSDKEYFRELNSEIKGSYPKELNVDGVSFLGISHIVRAGVEIKPTEELALRAGYGFATSGERYYEQTGLDRIVRNVNANVHTASFGLGYDSPRSFFADIACRLRFNPMQTMQLYQDYLTIEHVDSGATIYEDVASPLANSKQMLVSVVATIGWRF